MKISEHHTTLQHNHSFIHKKAGSQVFKYDLRYEGYIPLPTVIRFLHHRDMCLDDYLGCGRRGVLEGV